MEILVILCITLFMAALSLVLSGGKALGRISCAGHIIIAAFGTKLACHFAKSGQAISLFNLFYIDALSGFFLFTVCILNLAAALFSLGYMYEDFRAGTVSLKKLRMYYALFNLFSFSMFLVITLNNLGLLWVAIEMTTLASAFLVGFHNDKKSIEAAWKYVIICSVGIALALFGTILFYYASYIHGGVRSMNWSDMVAISSKLDPKLIKTAFLFILVGYGTKAGIAPMHTWLPDAHSQALSPISALLSGVLLKTAVYAILRFSIIVNGCVGQRYTSSLLVFFGLLSLGISAGFILVQKDLKRLLAYSSIEHVGIICIGCGIGGAMGFYGALLHVFNHAMTKSAMFFAAGDVVKKYKTNSMAAIRGVATCMPFTGWVLIIAGFALIGSPPFSIFISEIIILISAFAKGSYMVSALFLLFISVAFGGMIHHLSRVVYGRPPEGAGCAREPLSGKAAFVLVLIFVCMMGLWIPPFINSLLVSAAHVLRGA